MTRLPLSVVVPARNEAETIGSVVHHLLSMDWVDEVVVVDNASQDDTAKLAQEAGARSVFEPQAGMGHAVRAGLAAAAHDWVMKVDADLEKFNVKLFSEMVDARGGNIGLIKGDWTDPKDNMPMTRLLVKPGIAWLFPGLSGLRSPNTGIYLVNRSLIAHQEIVGNYAADLDVMVRVYAAGAEVIEADIGRIEHDMRDVGHYNKMAETIMGFLLLCQQTRITEEVVVLAQTAGDVLQNALGLCSVRAKAGALVTVFLEDVGSAQAEVLKDTLAAWPTSRVLPLAEAKTFAPEGPEERIQLLCSAALSVHGFDVQTGLTARGCSMPEPLVMAGSDGFRSDHGFDVTSVLDVKSNALTLAGLPPAASPREVFQSLSSYVNKAKAS
ncbi:glycosyltransferase [Roseovarius rhodophyticola]|uniref:Glycosyltransferase n=1 Tax=Roseovarius rhodophyticola TaxID=3080827 RepID=A0ABZ2TBN8_9RHOB|nr:glycosyltransferase [Roseovarius sp. W115]MDV2930837.1 glycosyltransferase [Roseovarius sp. W115]